MLASLSTLTSATDVAITSPADFSATTITLAPVSDAGRKLFSGMFGAGAAEVTIPKSSAMDFETFCTRKGLRVS